MKRVTNKISINNNSINIGNRNKIKDANIGNNEIEKNNKEKKNIVEKYPIVTGISVTIIGGILIYIFLETNLWNSIKSFIYRLGI